MKKPVEKASSGIINHMSINTPAEFKRHIVEADFQEFSSKPSDLRLAYHAAQSLFALRDWTFNHYRKSGGWSCGGSVGEYQKFLAGECADFDLLSDIANATKHLTLESNRARTDLRHASELKKIPGAFQANAFQANAFQTKPSLIVKPSADKPRFLTDVVQSVHQMWDEIFARFGWQ